VVKVLGNGIRGNLGPGTNMGDSVTLPELTVVSPHDPRVLVQRQFSRIVRERQHFVIL